MRYCEILLGYQEGTNIRAEVWGTQSLNLCPAVSWDALDPDAIQAEHGADMIMMNGPRQSVMDMGGLESPDDERRTFGDLEMRRVATIVVDPMSIAAGSYQGTTVERTSVFEYWSGFLVYELVSPAGAVYVMQSMSQIVDPDLTMEDLPDLGSRLDLPEGWSYRVSRRITDLVVDVESEITVLQDDLQNSYSLRSEGEPVDTLPVLDDGTGTPCSSDAECEGLDASHCLIFGDMGYCTIEGCGGGECGEPYLCCSDCAAATAPMLPFDGSACIPGLATEQLTDMAGCTCE
jgi:hypothetical protein